MFFQSEIRQFIVACNSFVIMKLAVMAAWEETPLAAFHFSLRFSHLSFRNTMVFFSYSTLS